MGNCAQNNSLTSGDYNDKLDESKKLNKPEGEVISKAALTNLKLMGDQGDWATMAKSDFKRKQLPDMDNEEKKKQLEDLREAHFKLGYDPTDYASEFAGNYQKINPVDMIKNPVDTHALQKTIYFYV